MVMWARSPLAIIVATLCSAALIAFTYFVIVQPQIDNANEQVDDAFNRAQPTLDQSQRLTACINRAEGDPVKIQACADRYR
jgi:hypothetical protein